MPKNWDTNKKQPQGKENVQYMLENWKAKKLLCGSPEAPRMFFDENGQLHIVLYGPDENSKLTTPQLHLIEALSPNDQNQNHGYGDLGSVEHEGAGGIYVHVSLSPPLDKVCPCKLLPNEICGCVQ